MVKTTPSSIFEFLELYDGVGTLAGTSTWSGSGATLTATLAAAGPYTLLARDQGNDYTAGYQLTLVRLNGACPGFTFTDDPIVTGVTLIRTAHVTELRQAVDNLRLNRGLAPFTYTDPTLAAGVTTILAVHITELRTALDRVYDDLLLTRPVYTDPILVAGGPVMRVHLEEIRAAIRAVE